ncbi:hypothetical protein ABK040_015161 [Willaertia magna]
MTDDDGTIDAEDICNLLFAIHNGNFNDAVYFLQFLIEHFEQVGNNSLQVNSGTNNVNNTKTVNQTCKNFIKLFKEMILEIKTQHYFENLEHFVKGDDNEVYVNEILNNLTELSQSGLFDLEKEIDHCNYYQKLLNFFLEPKSFLIFKKEKLNDKFDSFLSFREKLIEDLKEKLNSELLLFYNKKQVTNEMLKQRFERENLKKKKRSTTSNHLLASKWEQQQSYLLENNENATVNNKKKRKVLNQQNIVNNNATINNGMEIIPPLTLSINNEDSNSSSGGTSSTSGSNVNHLLLQQQYGNNNILPHNRRKNSKRGDSASQQSMNHVMSVRKNNPMLDREITSKLDFKGIDSENNIKPVKKLYTGGISSSKTLRERMFYVLEQHKNGAALTWDQIQSEIQGNRAKIWATLCMLVNFNIVVQEGLGRRGRPFKYRLNSNVKKDELEKFEETFQQLDREAQRIHKEYTNILETEKFQQQIGGNAVTAATSQLGSSVGNTNMNGVAATMMNNNMHSTNNGHIRLNNNNPLNMNNNTND